MSEQREAGRELSSPFSVKRRVVAPGFLGATGSGAAVGSDVSLWRCQMCVRGLGSPGLGVQVSVARQAFLDDSFLSLFKNASCPGE